MCKYLWRLSAGDLDGTPADEGLKMEKLLSSEITRGWLFDRKLEVWGPVANFAGTGECKQILYFKCWGGCQITGVGRMGKKRILKKRVGLF